MTMGYVFNTDPNDDADLQAQLDVVTQQLEEERAVAAATVLRQARSIRQKDNQIASLLLDIEVLHAQAERDNRIIEGLSNILAEKGI